MILPATNESLSPCPTLWGEGGPGEASVALIGHGSPDPAALLAQASEGRPWPVKALKSISINKAI